LTVAKETQQCADENNKVAKVTMKHNYFSQPNYTKLIYIVATIL